ncbi:MAG: hypothetical protein LUE23_04440 [Lachnospiraceae bacterium]|nr:hypothetical protein [Lachnospiraceae bacterium]
MAKIGFEYIVAAKLDETTSTSLATLTYTDAREIGPGATASGSPSSADVKDYGDDRVVLTDTSFTGGTMSLELNEPTLENEAWMLGHELTEDGGMVCREDDVAPYLGVGFVGKSKKENDSIIYRAKIYVKAQFKEPTDENSTKQDTVNFTHTTMEGNLFKLDSDTDKIWKLVKDFSTLTEAKAYVDEVLCMDSSAADDSSETETA